jgi:peptide/nickel transport system ATP-binding protein
MKPADENISVRFECRDLRKSYLKKIPGKPEFRFPALDGINLTILEGKITSLFGKSGAGKSTLSRILMKLENFDSGRILYRGTDIEQVKTREFRKKNQILFQNPYLSVNPVFTVTRILADPLRVARLEKTEIRKRIRNISEILEIPESLLKRRPRELSGGQLQRIVLGRSLILNPEFVVLDEPFSSLDEIMAGRLAEHFKAIFRQMKVGALFISHHVRRVKYLSDFVAHIRKGKIIFQGSKEEFFSLHGRNFK